MSVVPESCGIAFKEWAGVCDALERGLQTLILRKGGVREDAGVFTPEHPTFWLYPTRLHESEQGLRTPPRPRGPIDPKTTPIRTLASVESIAYVDREDRLDALEPFHVWTPETVRKRFHYREPGVWALAVRVRSLPETFAVPVTPEQEGCKTWVELESPLPTSGLTPALDDDAWAARRALLDEILGAAR